MRQRKRAVRFLAGTAFLFAALPGPHALRADATGGNGHTVTLAVFSINDFHGSFLADPGKGIPGVAAVAHTLDSLKEAYPYHVTVAGGDNFGGSYFSTVAGEALLPVMFDEMGITVSAVGNHEFDNGQAFLARRWADAPNRPADWRLDYVCANITDSLGRIPDYVRPYAVRTVKISPTCSARVAFVGLITSSTPLQTRPANIGGLVFHGDYEAAIARLEGQSGFDSVRTADVRLLLTHIGSRMEDGRAVWDDQDASHLEHLPAPLFHGILSAHSHQPVCGTVSAASLPMVQGEWHGNYIGVLKVRFDTLAMQVVGVEPALERVPVGRAYADSRAREWDRLIGHLMETTRIAGGYPLGKVLAVSATVFTHEREKKHTFTELGTLVCEAYAAAYRQAAGADDGEAVIGVCHYGTVRAPLPQGEVRVMDVGEVLPFSNRIRVFRLTGRELRRLVEFGVNNLAYGRMQFSSLLVDADSADVFHVRGLRYVSPSGEGHDITDDGVYVVAADEFMTTGGDGYPESLFPEDKEVACTLPTTTEALLRYVEQAGHIKADPARTAKWIRR